MVHVLILTGAGDGTAPLVERALARRGVPYLRLDTERVGTDVAVEFALRRNSAAVRIDTGEQTVDAAAIRSIWYRRPLSPEPAGSLSDPEARRFAAEELTSSLYGSLFALNCRWVSHPAAIRIASHKLCQLRAAVELGFRVPQTLVSRDPSRIRAFVQEQASAGRRAVAKLVSKGPPLADSPEQQYTVFTTLVSETDLACDASLMTCPAIYQAYVEKQYEVRCTVVGQRVFACAIHSQATERTRIDWRRYDLDNTPHLPLTLEPALERACIALTRRFNLAFSAIDLVVTPDGDTVFLELNPNGQWAWIQEMTGLPIAQSIADLLSDDLNA